MKKNTTLSRICTLVIQNYVHKGGEKNGIQKACNLGTKYCTDGRMQT